MAQVFGPDMQNLIGDMRKSLNKRQVVIETLAREHAPLVGALKSDVGKELIHYLIERRSECLDRVAALIATEEDKVRLQEVTALLVHYLKKIEAYEEGMNQIMQK